MNLKEAVLSYRALLNVLLAVVVTAFQVVAN